MKQGYVRRWTLELKNINQKKRDKMDNCNKHNAKQKR